MANTIFKLRRSSVAGKKPTTTDISIGELAINLTDRKLYSSDGSNTWEIGANLTTLAVSTNTTVNNVIISGGVYANGSFGAPGQVLASNSSGLYWTSAADGALPIRQQYTANGSTTSFAVPGGYVSNNISVFLNGVLLRNGTEVDVTSGTNFVITPAPANGSLIDVVGSSAITTLGFNTSVSQQFTANGTANTFSVTNGYIPNQIQVYLNGVKQVPGVDVDVSSGNNVAFTITPSNGFIVDVYGYQTAVVATSNVLTVGANVTLNTSTISIGNSTVNTQITAGNIALNGSLLTIGNSTVNTSLDGGTLVLGTNTATFGAAAYFVANGNVGIGTSSPSYRLQVTGPDNFTSAYFYSGLGQSAIRIETGGNDKAVVEQYTNGNGNWRIGPGITVAGAYEINSVTAGVTRMLVSSTGDVSIATSVDHNSRLNIKSTGAEQHIVLEQENTTADGWGIRNYGAAGGSLEFSRMTSTTTFSPVMTITPNSRVGIGTSSPNDKLTIYGANTVYSDTVSGGTSGTNSDWAYHKVTVGGTYSGSVYNLIYGGGIAYTYYSANNGQYWVGTSQQSPLILYTNNSERLRITSNGDIGIGTSSPNSKLMVNQTTAGRAGIYVDMPTGAETTASGITVKGYSPSIELMDKDNVQNWHMAIDDNDGNKLVFARGYGPGQGIAPALAIDSSDRVTMPYQPAFWAYGTGTQSWSGTATYTKLDFSGGGQYITSNKSSGWSQTNSRFTCPVAGTYEFIVSITTSTASSTGPAVYLYKNGSLTAEVIISYSVGPYTKLYGQFLFDYAAGDYVEVFVANFNNSSFTIERGRCSFSGKLVS